MTYIKHNNTQISHLKDSEKAQTKYFTYTPIENDRVTHNRMTSGPTTIRFHISASNFKRLTTRRYIAN